MGVVESVEVFITESLSVVLGLPPGATTFVKALFSEEDDDNGRHYRCGLCGEEDDHYKSTCPERYCDHCECDDPDCAKYDDGIACECCA